MRPRSMLRVAGSTSTKAGRAPSSSTMLLVATQESGVVTTSSPGPTPASRRPISSAAVPELNVRTGRPPHRRDSSASNSFTLGPEVIHPERSTSATPAIVSSSIEGRVNGRKASPGTELASRDEEHAAHDESDADQLLRGERLPEQVPGGERVDDVPDREHGVGDRDRDSRQADDPHGDADDVAREPAGDVRLQRELHAHGQDVRGGEVEAADR